MIRGGVRALSLYCTVHMHILMIASSDNGIAHVRVHAAPLVHCNLGGSGSGSIGFQYSAAVSSTTAHA